MTPLPIDLDAEAIQFEGHWFTRDELARKIKGMLDTGDFAVGKPSQALEQLTQTLSTLRTLSFRVTPEMADAINAISAKHNRGVGSIIREALTMHLGLPPSAESERAPTPASTATAPGKRAPSPAGRRQTEPEAPVVPVVPAPPVAAPAVAAPILPPPVPPDLKATQQMPMPPQVLAGPGALKAAGPSSAPHAVPPGLTAVGSAPTVVLDKSAFIDPPTTPPTEPKKSDEEAVERQWFRG